jgi:DNA repair exonuclease SbcCD ATPase subunit
MSPPSVVASPSSATKAAGDAQADYPSDDIRQSIAALRSVLMLDTPSRNILNRRLSSPPQTCQPQLRNAVQSPEQSSPGLSLQDRLDDEIQRRRELESAHESLLKLQKQQSNQLELMTEARKDLENRVTKLQSEINVEGGARSQERVQWLRKIEAARQGNKMLQPSKLDESRSQQRLDQSNFVHARDLEALREELQSKQTEHELERKEWQSRLTELNGRLLEVRAAADTAENARLSAQEKVCWVVLPRRQQSSLSYSRFSLSFHS